MSGLPRAKAEEIGFDAARLQVAYDLLAHWTAGPDAAIPGGALLVGRNGRVVEPQFFGRHGPEPDAGPIRRDGAFLSASISKPVTYLAAIPPPSVRIGQSTAETAVPHELRLDAIEHPDGDWNEDRQRRPGRQRGAQ